MQEMTKQFPPRTVSVIMKPCIAAACLRNCIFTGKAATVSGYITRPRPTTGWKGCGTGWQQAASPNQQVGSVKDLWGFDSLPGQHLPFASLPMPYHQHQQVRFAGSSVVQGLPVKGIAHDGYIVRNTDRL